MVAEPAFEEAAKKLKEVIDDYWKEAKDEVNNAVKDVKHMLLETEDQIKKMQKDQEKEDEFKVMIKQQFERFEIMIQEQKDNKEKNQYKDKRVMTSRRDFPSLPKYGGKHEEFEDWKFTMVAFLSEEVEYKELTSRLDQLTDVPDDDEAKRIIEQVQSEFGQTDDKNWMKHQLYQVLCLNLTGKA